MFGLGFGALTLLIVLFSFFNEVVIAPFIQPSRHVSATPIIVSPDGVILTNAHVVDDASKVMVRLTDRREFEARVLGSVNSTGTPRWSAQTS